MHLTKTIPLTLAAYVTLAVAVNFDFEYDTRDLDVDNAYLGPRAIEDLDDLLFARDAEADADAEAEDLELCARNAEAEAEADAEVFEGDDILYALYARDPEAEGQVWRKLAEKAADLAKHGGKELAKMAAEDVTKQQMEKHGRGGEKKKWSPPTAEQLLRPDVVSQLDPLSFGGGSKKGGMADVVQQAMAKHHMRKKARKRL